MEYLFYYLYFTFFIKITILLDFFWDNSININTINTNLFITYFNNKIIIFFQNFEIFNIFLYLDNVLLILFIYTFFKTILISSIFELIWPTQFFNKKNNLNFKNYKNKSFIEFLLKIKNFNKYIFIFNTFFFKNFRF